jgi:hypothetical protein
LRPRKTRLCPTPLATARRAPARVARRAETPQTPARMRAVGMPRANAATSRSEMARTRTPYRLRRRRKRRRSPRGTARSRFHTAREGTKTSPMAKPRSGRLPGRYLRSGPQRSCTPPSRAAARPMVAMMTATTFLPRRGRTNPRSTRRPKRKAPGRAARMARGRGRKRAKV